MTLAENSRGQDPFLAAKVGGILMKTFDGGQIPSLPIFSYPGNQSSRTPQLEVVKTEL